MAKSSAEKPTSNNDCWYRGIRKRNWGKWVTEIRLPNSRERIWLGSYDTAEKAARAFDAAAFCLRGPNAKFNFPMNPSAIAASSSSPLSAAEIQAVAAKYANEGAANPPEQEQRVSELASPSLASNNLSTLLDSELDWSFLELQMEDSGNSRLDFGSPRSSIDHFLPVHDSPAVDLDEELEFSEEGSFLWSF